MNIMNAMNVLLLVAILLALGVAVMLEFGSLLNVGL